MKNFEAAVRTFSSNLPQYFCFLPLSPATNTSQIRTTVQSLPRSTQRLLSILHTWLKLPKIGTNNRRQQIVCQLSIPKSPLWCFCAELHESSPCVGFWGHESQWGEGFTEHSLWGSHLRGGSSESRERDRPKKTQTPLPRLQTKDIHMSIVKHLPFIFKSYVKNGTNDFVKY